MGDSTYVTLADTPGQFRMAMALIPGSPKRYKLLQSWNLPEVYCCIARDHHIEEISPKDVSMAIVRLANESSLKLGIGLNPKPDLELAATREAVMLKTSKRLLAELEVMLEYHLAQAA